MSALSAATCGRCGTFVARAGLCAPCSERDLALKQLTRRARLVVAGLGATALMLSAPMLYTGATQPKLAGGMLIYALLIIAPLGVGSGVVWRKRTPGPALASLFGPLLCPNLWILVAMGAPKMRAILVLVAATWLLSLVLIFRLFTFRRQLGARGLRI